MSVRTRFDISPLHLSFDQDSDWLDAVEFGEVVDGVDPDRWRPLSDRFAYLVRGVGDDVVVGFRAQEFSGIHPEADLPAAFDGPRFDVPVLGLAGATAGEILLAAGTFLEGENTVSRILFDKAVAKSGEDAVVAWKHCLQAGDLMAHYGLGYTLLGLGQHRLAYRHLRYYTELLPVQPWAWRYRGTAAERADNLAEARDCYRRAVALDEDRDGDEPTDASDQLARLLREHPDLDAEEAHSPQPDSGVPERVLLVDRPFDSTEYLQPILPQLSQVSGHPRVLFVAGGPLAGKSSVVALLRQQGDERVPEDPVEIDPGWIRRQLPEFNQRLALGESTAASSVREQVAEAARELVRGAVADGRNLIVHGLGAGQPGAFSNVLQAFVDAGYDVRLLWVDCPTEDSLRRNDVRAHETGLRYDAEEVRRLHVEVARRYEDWRELKGLRWSTYSTASKAD